MYKVYTSEEKLILDEARRIIKKRKRENMYNIISKVKQKFNAIGLIAMSIITPIITGDATVSAFLLPLGIGALFMKESD